MTNKNAVFIFCCFLFIWTIVDKTILGRWMGDGVAVYILKDDVSQKRVTIRSRNLTLIVGDKVKRILWGMCGTNDFEMCEK